VSLVYQAERTSDPGAEMSGLRVPRVDGPRLEKEEMPSALVVDPTPITLVASPGELAVPQAGPEFPWEKSGMMPVEKVQQI